MAYRLTKEHLLIDLYAAFACAKKHKSNKEYVKVFEGRLSYNIRRLADDLYSRNYKPEPSSCFIVDRPKKREVFAAQFRDRIVHHLYFNYTHELFERTFIQDTYSCIPNRGTHYGIDRLAQHIRKETLNYKREAYVMKLDIRGYFMHINRQRLLDIALGSLEKMRHHKAKDNLLWEDIIDFDFVEWLTKEIVLLNPKDSCHIVGRIDDWDGLDHSKSLFHTNNGCGIPIGNLTSQLFSNVYLNMFDQFMKRELHCNHYGRYVDDAYIVSHDRDWLLSLVPDIRRFLKESLELDIHMGKLHLINTRYGTDFLGAFVRPYRNYVSNATLRRTKDNINRLNFNDEDAVFRSVNSFLGTLVHCKSYNLRRMLFHQDRFLKIGKFDSGITKFKLIRNKQIKAHENNI